MLAVLALMGVVALAATVLTRSAHPAPRTLRAAAETNKAHSGLNQQLQKFLASQPQLVAPSLPRVTPLAPAPQTCFVNQCSLRPCVEFVQSGGGPSTVISARSAVQVVTPQAGPRARSTCARHGSPRTLPVSAQALIAHPVSASTPVVSPQPAISSASSRLTTIGP